MKRKRLQVGFVLLMLLICTGGCAGEEEEVASVMPELQQELTDDPSLPPWVEITDDPLMAQPVINSVVGLEEGRVLAREGGLLVEIWDGNLLSSVSQMGGEAVIAPQHRGHTIDATNYGVDENYACWIEVPRIPDAQTMDWYLYLQPRDGGDAVLLDEGAYDDARTREIGIGSYLDYESGRAIWLKPQGDGSYQVKLYRAESGETTVLDTFSMIGGQVAIGDNDAVWCRKTDDYSSVIVMHCDLTSGEVTQLGQIGEGMEDPLICGRYLVMIDVQGYTLWVYDLEQKRWTNRIDNTQVTEKAVALGKPMVLDDTHVGVMAYGSGELYQLRVIDLEQGMVYLAETAPYTPLYFQSVDADDASLTEVEYAISRIQPFSEAYSTNFAMRRQMNDDEIESVIQMLAFHW